MAYSNKNEFEATTPVTQTNWQAWLLLCLIYGNASGSHAIPRVAMECVFRGSIWFLASLALGLPVYWDGLAGNGDSLSAKTLPTRCARPAFKDGIF